MAKAPKDQSVIPGSHASPEAVAHIMTQKFVMGSPIYRQEQELNRSGVMLSRQTMSNWILKAAELWLQPLYDELHRRLLEHDVLHADETTLEVLRPEKGKDPKKAYMWLYRTGGDSAEPIVLYDFRPDRKAENAMNFLKSFSGWLHADGYQSYHRLPENIRVVGCWAHARRKFVEALAALPEENRKGSTAEEGVAFFTKLLAKEKQLQGLSPEEKAAMCLKEEKPILDALLAWATTKTAAPKSALGKALHYLTEQWPYLMRYLEDG